MNFLAWWTKVVGFATLDYTILAVFNAYLGSYLSFAQKVTILIIALPLPLVVLILSWPVTPKQVIPEQGAAVITKDSVIAYQPKPQFISTQEAHRAVANSVRNSVRAQGRRMSGEPNITSAELKRDEELWYVEGSYAWQTGILQTVGFHALVNARTGQVTALTFDS